MAGDAIGASAIKRFPISIYAFSPGVPRPQDNPPDPELIAACLSGEARAWDLLIARYQALIFSTCIRTHLSPEEAEDVFQNVCLILLDHLGDLKDHTRLSYWLISTTRREAWRMQQQRSKAHFSDLDDVDAPLTAELLRKADTAPLPEESLLHLEDQQMVREGMDRLGSRCKVLLTLLYCEDPSTPYAQISKHLNMAIGSIGPSRTRCLQKLQKILEQNGF